MKKSLLFTIALGAVSIAGAQEVYSTWSHHKFVVLNTSPSGANAGTVHDFPVLVRLGVADSAIFRQSFGRGADIRFTKVGDAVRLPHQIEAWDSAAKTAAVWVRVDTVTGYTNPAIRLHWGKSGAADSSNGAAVFDTARGFAAVFHLNEATNDTLRDATRNGFRAVPRQSGAQSVPGDTAALIGRGKAFVSGPGTDAPGGEDNGATGGYYEVLNSAAGPIDGPVDGPYSMSAWTFITSDPSQAVYRMVLSKGDYQYNLMKSSASNGVFEFNPFAEVEGWRVTSAGPIVQGTWHHIAAVFYSAGSDTLFLDGAPVAGPEASYASANPRNTSANLHIGRRADHGDNTTTPANNRFWHGLMDEIRLSTAARSSSWMKLEFENQKPAQTLVSFSDTLPARIVSLTGVPASRPFALRASPTGQGLAFEVQGAPGLRARVSVLDLRGTLLWSGAGARVEWNGQAGAKRAAAGVYLARATVLDAQGRVLGHLKQRVILGH